MLKVNINAAQQLYIAYTITINIVSLASPSYEVNEICHDLIIPSDRIGYEKKDHLVHIAYAFCRIKYCLTSLAAAFIAE